MSKDQFIREALNLSQNAIDYYVSQILSDRFPQKSLVEGSDGLFNIEQYAQAGHCTITYKDVVYNQVLTMWRGREMIMGNMLPGVIRMGMSGGIISSMGPQSVDAEEEEIVDRAKNAWLEVQWRDHAFDIITMHWSSGMGGQEYHYWIIGESKEIAKEFIAEVCRWNLEIRGEVLVFDGGCWQKDAHLFQAIKGATFDNLILQGSLKQDIRDDMAQFFAARPTYEEYGIPWKRGILFVGLPGNGKTHAVKALINAMDQPCLYVKSFRADYGSEEGNIRNVFDRARKTAPCILVLEDLDSLLNDQNRSFFLNELDGFAANIGVVTLATTNHPERLDPAILDRPSRFDRKYPFDLPEQAERQAYIIMWNTSLKPVLRLSDEAVNTLSELTEGFSFAYLKELFLSSMMRWIANGQQGTMEQTMSGQVHTLKEQMVSAEALAAIEPPQTPQMPPMFGQMMNRRMRIRGGM